jgi:membrane-bound ClpP family serine protease
MIEMGIVVGIGLLVSLVKMSWVWKMHMLSNPMLVDMLIFIGLLLIHWGTYSGVMVATVGAMTCSLTLSGARWLYGHVKAGTYVPGYFDIGSKLG